MNEIYLERWLQVITGERVNSLYCTCKILIYVQVTGNVCIPNEFTYVFTYHFFTTPFALPIYVWDGCWINDPIPPPLKHSISYITLQTRVLQQIAEGFQNAFYLNTCTDTTDERCPARVEYCRETLPRSRFINLDSAQTAWSVRPVTRGTSAIYRVSLEDRSNFEK